MIARLRGKPVDRDAERARPRGRRRRLPAACHALRAAQGGRTPTRSSSRRTCTSARTRSSSTASPTQPSGSSSSSCSRSPASARRLRWRSCPATHPAELRRAILREDARLFQTIPGIGKKTAQRVVLELKERIAPLAAVEAPHLGSGDGHTVAGMPSSSWATRRPRPSSASPIPIPICPRPSACARRSERHERRVTTAVLAPDEERARGLVAAAVARRVRRAGARQGAARDRARGREGEERRSTTSCSPARRAGEDEPRVHREEELGVGLRSVAGPGARAQGRPRGDPDLAGGAGRPLRGRDPPPEPRGRGDPLPGARGLPPRHHRRPGAGREDAHPRPASRSRSSAPPRGPVS